MEKKYYLVRFFKKIDKTNEIELTAYKFLKSELSVWNEENMFLYVQPFSGNIAFTDVDFGLTFTKKLPLVFKETDDGLVDIYNGYPVTIAYPIILSEIPKEEALKYEELRDKDNISLINVQHGVKQFNRMMKRYVDLCKKLTAPVIFDEKDAKESFVRSRSK